MRSGLAALMLVTLTACSGGVHHAVRRALSSETTTGSLSAAPLTPAPSSSGSGAGAGTAFPAVPLPAVVNHGDRARPEVALTFDSNLTDSMIGELRRHRVTSFDNVAVIDELDSLQVPATFFLAGKWMEQYPDTTRRLAADPLFELGSHSYAHIGFAAHCYHLGQLRPAQMAPDVVRSENLLHQFTDHPTPYFRFPGGCYDHTALDALAPTHVTVIGFDVASGDAFGRSVKAIVDTTLREVQNGSIVVMHITGGNTAPLTDRALPAVVAALRSRGYQLVRVSDLLAAAGGRSVALG